MEPIFEFSNEELSETFIFRIDSNDSSSLVKNLQLVFPKSTINFDNDENFIIFDFNKSYFKFVGICNVFAEALKNNDVIGVDIEDMLSNLDTRKIKKFCT